ncbi:DUF2842 domain-containing protein [Sphingomonas sp. LB-2]|uniref:DUF2842 domain-containing protein n=1 Tax=Sphingomonas caeni TaxID=2984949 RepID=UPI00222E5A6C|nr:DUF2842 domain-containing protein [Sphingomonas caeni]MCW3847790.1 DUF2842 domain-containing protein [Sphingomonas caeni]
MKPSWRKPVGALTIVATACLWVFLIASFSKQIGALPVLVQLPIYLVAGVAWIAPLKPLLQWMETGRWKP